MPRFFCLYHLFQTKILGNLKPFLRIRCILTRNPTIAREKDPIFRIFLHALFCKPSTGIGSKIKG